MEGLRCTAEAPALCCSSSAQCSPDHLHVASSEQREFHVKSIMMYVVVTGAVMTETKAVDPWEMARPT